MKNQSLIDVNKVRSNYPVGATVILTHYFKDGIEGTAKAYVSDVTDEGLVIVNTDTRTGLKVNVLEDMLLYAN